MLGDLCSSCIYMLQYLIHMCAAISRIHQYDTVDMCIVHIHAQRIVEHTWIVDRPAILGVRANTRMHDNVLQGRMRMHMGAHMCARVRARPHLCMHAHMSACMPHIWLLEQPRLDIATKRSMIDIEMQKPTLVASSCATKL